MIPLRSVPQKIQNFFFDDRRSSIVWLLIRVYVGYQWLIAGWEKVSKPVWIGEQAGSAVTGFLQGALLKMTGDHPSVSLWYGWLIEHVFLPNAEVISYLVVGGEILVGVALITGMFVRFSAGAGVFMNFNYLFAGTISSNPLLLLLGLLLMRAHRVAEYIGVKLFYKKA